MQRRHFIYQNTSSLTSKYGLTKELENTQGLFRYQYKEMHGIVVNPNNTQSCIQGYCFAKVVDPVTGRLSNFYQSSASTAQFQEITSDQDKTNIAAIMPEVNLKYQEYFSAKSNLERSDRGIA